jgi:cyanophycinase
MKKLLFLIILAFPYVVHAEAKRYLLGNAEDVKPKLNGPAFHLQGGGTDVDAAFQWMFDQVRGCTDCSTKLDVVVLRASGEDAYNDYLLKMKGVDSVETIVITDRKDAEQKNIEKTIKNAEVVFFAGGDQCNYVKNFKGTPVETAVESVFKRGGGLGGTSAGVAIMGDATYDACTGSTTGAEGLADPYHESISFTYDFFHLPNMKGTITDQHLVERDRIGRTFAFLARQIEDKKFSKIWGVAIDRETSVALNKDGLGTVMGKGPAYFILADHRPEVCKPKQPLTYSNFKIWKVNTGGKFDLKHRPKSGYYLRSVSKGVLDKNPYNAD